MTYEPHPFPEPRFWRVAPPVTAAVLAAIGFVVMLAVAPGSTRSVVLVVVLVVQVVLMGGRGLYLWRSARVDDRAVRWQQFFFGWSAFAGLTFLVSGAAVQTGQIAPVLAALHIAVGLAFAAVLLALLNVTNRVPAQRPRRDPGSR